MTLSIQLTNQMRKGHIFPAFNNSLIGVDPFCDAGCKVLLSKDTVAIFDPDGEIILTGWHELHGSLRWLLSILPELYDLPLRPSIVTATTVGAFSSYYIPIIDSLV